MRSSNDCPYLLSNFKIAHNESALLSPCCPYSLRRFPHVRRFPHEGGDPRRSAKHCTNSYFSSAFAEEAWIPAFAGKTKERAGKAKESAGGALLGMDNILLQA